MANVMHRGWITGQDAHREGQRAETIMAYLARQPGKAGPHNFGQGQVTTPKSPAEKQVTAASEVAG